MSRRLPASIMSVVAAALIGFGCGRGVDGSAGPGTTANSSTQGPTATSPGPQTQTGSFTCTQVIGFSQTRQWFLDSPVFESKAGNDAWQLLWNEGGGVEEWARPDYGGWSRPIASPCTERSTEPDRVIITIASLELPWEASAFAPPIQSVIEIVRQRYPSVRQIVLQTVVGGPGGEECANGHGVVNESSAMQPAIEEAIATLVGGDVVAGATPSVRSCQDYADQNGHLEPEATGPIGAEIAGFYAHS